MKVTARKSAPAFAPVTVTITLESAVEVQALYDLANASINDVTAIAKVRAIPYALLARLFDNLYAGLSPVTGRIGHGDARIA